MDCLMIHEQVWLVLLVLEVHACIAKDEKHFHQLTVYLVQNFRVDNSLLEKRGALIIRRLCVLLDAETVYRKLSAILQEESDLDFASIMVQALNLILLTSYELANLRDLLKKSLFNDAGKNLFLSLYTSWCHSPMAIISLCLLAQAYQHASSVIQSLVEEDINVKFLVQLDKLIHLLETPTFAYLRLQTITTISFLVPMEILCCIIADNMTDENGIAFRYVVASLLIVVESSTIMKQSVAFKILRTRLKTVPSYSFSGEQFKRLSSGNAFSEVNHFGGSEILEDGMNEDQRNVRNGINFASWLQQLSEFSSSIECILSHRHYLDTVLLHLPSRKENGRRKFALLIVTSTLVKVQEVQTPEEPRRPSPVPDMNRPPSRSSRRGPGQLQL
ncbi:UNVERIFIED_CONTAM: protein VAC14 [Sesamum calycinum]|uniref:Protein VAC14 n=1 Tax=Sesamum calycinum TaxID=2727403 RepID=A0AAW2QY81_9LAMI